MNALGAAVAFGRADEGRGGRGAEPGDLLLEVTGHVLAAVVVADAEARGRLLLDAAEALGHALPDRLQRLVAGAVEGGVDADAFRRAVIDGDEHRDLAVLDGEGGGHVGSPHRVDRLRDDRAVVVARAAGAARRVAAGRPFSRIRRRTRSFEVRRPAWRSRAQTFR